MTVEFQASEVHQILTFARKLARLGGDIAQSYYGRSNPRRKFDESLITEADLAVQEVLRQELQASYPDHRFLGEEDEQRRPMSDYQGPLWVVDPIDGTAAFSAGMPTWSISVAFFYEQKPMVGAVFLPITGEMYSAALSQPAHLNDAEIRVRNHDSVDNESLLLTYSRFHRDFHTTFPGKIRSLGSTAAHIAYVARGAAWGSLMSNVHIWDLAAALVILKASGGEIRTMDGELFDPAEYLEGQSITQPLLAAAKGQHRGIRGYLSQQTI